MLSFFNGIYGLFVWSVCLFVILGYLKQLSIYKRIPRHTLCQHEITAEYFYTYLSLTKQSFVDTVPPVYKAKRVKGEAKLPVHKTGCARSEGFYKIETPEKAQYLTSALRHVTIVKKRDDVDNKTAASQVRERFDIFPYPLY